MPGFDCMDETTPPRHAGPDPASMDSGFRRNDETRQDVAETPPLKAGICNILFSLFVPQGILSSARSQIHLIPQGILS